MNSLVSILIPAYNAERWIGDTLKSAIRQTWPRKEIIVVDDGSSDRTFEIIKSFESPILKVIRQPNCGASAARNKALSMAQGDYIQWLDADDLLAPEKIEYQLKELERGHGPLTPLSGSFGEFFTRIEKADFIPNSLWRDLDPVEWIVAKFRGNIWMINSAWMVSRTLTDMVGPWDERLSLDDDGEYFCRVVAASHNVHFVPEAKVYYRQWHSGSISRTASEKARRSLFLSLTLCVDHLRALEDSERTRDANVALLQTWSHYFYPEEPDLYERVCNLAREMGGIISPPRLKWKYALIKRMFGWGAVKKTRGIAANLKLYTSFQLDRWCSKILN